MKYHVTGMISGLKSFEIHMNLHAFSNSQSTAVRCDKEWLMDKKLKLCVTVSNISYKESPRCSILGATDNQSMNYDYINGAIIHELSTFSIQTPKEQSQLSV